MSETRKAKTMSLAGNDYAKVAERLKLFREDNPKSKTQTDHKYLEDGSVEFKAWLWKDKTEYLDLVKSGVTDMATLLSTADSDGDAKGQATDKKAFEKLQTIAVGRALANLGYLGSGEIASFEEMEEFNAYKDRQKADAISIAIESLEDSKTIDQLKETFLSLGALVSEESVVAAKDKRKAELVEKQELQKKPAKANKTKVS